VKRVQPATDPLGGGRVLYSSPVSVSARERLYLVAVREGHCVDYLLGIQGVEGERSIAGETGTVVKSLGGRWTKTEEQMGRVVMSGGPASTNVWEGEKGEKGASS
jgi:hypothetical protein